MKSLYFENSLPRIFTLKLSSIFNKNAAFGRFAPVQYAEVKEPEIPNSKWLKIKNLSCGICGTDIHFLFMDMDPKCFPAALPGVTRKYLGHELVGEIIELGKDVEEFSIGDRVTMRIDWLSCYQLEIDPPCRQCKSGNYMLCENLGKSEPPIADNGGGFSPVMVMHKSQPVKIPESLDDERAILVEPAACAIHTVMKRKPEKDETILVIGAGTIGLLTTAVAKTVSPESHVVCLARYPFQAEVAKKLGADEILLDRKEIYKDIAEHTGGSHFKGYFGNEILLGGFDVVYDTVGSDRTVNNALRWARGGGGVVLSGINFKPGKIDYSTIWNQEINFTGINCHATESSGETSFNMSITFLKETAFPVEEIITHHFPMENYKEAVKTFLSKKDTHAIKIVLDHPNQSK